MDTKYVRKVGRRRASAKRKKNIEELLKKPVAEKKIDILEDIKEIKNTVIKPKSIIDKIRSNPINENRKVGRRRRCKKKFKCDDQETSSIYINSQSDKQEVKQDQVEEVEQDQLEEVEQDQLEEVEQDSEQEHNQVDEVEQDQVEEAEQVQDHKQELVEEPNYEVDNTNTDIFEDSPTNRQEEFMNFDIVVEKIIDSQSEEENIKIDSYLDTINDSESVKTVEEIDVLSDEIVSEHDSDSKDEWEKEFDNFLEIEKHAREKAEQKIRELQ